MRSAAVMTLGFISLLSQGVLPLLLGALHSAGRLSEAGIGVAACMEALTLTLSSAVAGSFLRARRLGVYALASAAALALINVLTHQASGDSAVVGLRALAGIPEGLLFWIAVGFIARAADSERWAAILVAGSTILALLASVALTVGWIPGTPSNGGFLLVAGLSAVGIGAALLVPESYAELPRTSGSPTRLSWASWAALGGALLYTAAGMGVFIYLVPLAQGAGLDPGTANAAITALLAGQLAGSLAAVFVGGQWGHLRVLVAAGGAYLMIWPLYALHLPATVFVPASAAVGAITFFSIPFLYPLAVAADASRRTAVLSGPAQMLGSAVGPLLAALGMRLHGTTGLLGLSVVLLVLSLLLMLASARAVPLAA